MSLPGEYESWMCTSCKIGEHGEVMCTPIFYLCEDCCGEDINCEACSGSGGAHVCLYDEESEML